MRRRFPDFAFLLILWLPVLYIMELEWRYNEQYHYGYFVPLFTIYLVYLRLADRPLPSGNDPKTNYWLGVFLLTLIPLFIIRTANPDWRLIYWIATLLAFVATCILVTSRDGYALTWHLLPALGMVFLGVPWLVSFENSIMQFLMNVVSEATVEIVNLLGIYAVQSGNVIRLPNNVVGVEEACSGVRSLQSSLMAGYLFGELFRMHPIVRVLLMSTGALLTFGLNLLRTLTLTLITHHSGQSGYEKWHDPIGNLAMIFGFLLVLGLAWLLHGLFKNDASDAGRGNPSPDAKAQLGSAKTAYIGAAVIMIALGLNWLWFLPAKSTEEGFDFSEQDWGAYPHKVIESEINPITKAQLKYSVGKRVDWLTRDRETWTLFYFNWQKGKISSHAGVHRPENCLPATGMQFAEDYEDLVWQTPAGYTLSLKSMRFQGFGTHFYVFFVVWDEGGKQPWYSVSWMERVQDALHRRTVDGRHSLQIVVEGIHSNKEARAKVMELLESIY